MERADRGGLAKNFNCLLFSLSFFSGALRFPSINRRQSHRSIQAIIEAFRHLEHLGLVIQGEAQFQTKRATAEARKKYVSCSDVGLSLGSAIYCIFLCNQELA